MRNSETLHIMLFWPSATLAAPPAAPPATPPAATLFAAATYRCLSAECVRVAVSASSPGQPAAVEGPLPRVIWAYWHSDEPPAAVDACVATWRRHAIGWDIRLLSAATVVEWLDEGTDFPAITWSRLPQHQSDLFGLALLRRYGGVYMDATVILTADLGWLEAAMRGSDWFAYRDGKGAPEIFFYASRPGGYCVSAWWRALLDAWATEPELASPDAYRRALVDAKSDEEHAHVYLHPGRVGRALASRDAVFRRHLDASARRAHGSAYLLTLRAMQATGITAKQQLLPALAQQLTSPLPDDVRAQPLHKIQGMSYTTGLPEVVPGSWWAQCTGGLLAV